MRYLSTCQRVLVRRKMPYLIECVRSVPQQCDSTGCVGGVGERMFLIQVGKPVSAFAFPEILVNDLDQKTFLIVGSVKIRGSRDKRLKLAGCLRPSKVSKKPIIVPPARSRFKLKVPGNTAQAISARSSGRLA